MRMPGGGVGAQSTPAQRQSRPERGALPTLHIDPGPTRQARPTIRGRATPPTPAARPIRWCARTPLCLTPGRQGGGAPASLSPPVRRRPRRGPRGRTARPAAKIAWPGRSAGPAAAKPTTPVGFGALQLPSVFCSRREFCRVYVVDPTRGHCKPGDHHEAP